MNKNCQLFYKRLRILFPSIGFAEGKFLRDIKMQLRDFSMENPSAEYEDVVEFFGNPEEVYVNYIQSRGREDIYLKFQKRGTVKLVLHITVLAIILIWITIFYYWQKSYTVFYEELPKSKESILNEGDDYK